MDEIVRLCRPEIYRREPYQSARTEGSQDVDILLDANENPYPPYPATPDTIGLNRYPEPQPRLLVERLCRVYGVGPESMFLSRGADEAIDLLVRCFCAAGSDGIIITPPTFVMYETAAEIQGAGVYRVPLTVDFHLDGSGVLAAQSAQPGVKLVFLCSPNNPTANLLRRDDILHLASALFGRALVIVDQLYVDYSGEPDLSAEIADHPNLVVLRSLSKEYSLAGERLGVTIAHPEIIGILRRVMAPYSLTVSAIRTIAAAMTDEGLAYGRRNVARLVAERDRVRKTLEDLPGVRRVFPSDANFLLLETLDPALLTAVMAEHRIKIRDRSAVVEDAVRISIGTPTENDRMLAAFSAYAGRLGAAGCLR
jgi:histidinol-phosphate aminotransferase